MRAPVAGGRVEVGNARIDRRVIQGDGVLVGEAKARGAGAEPDHGDRFLRFPEAALRQCLLLDHRRGTGVERVSSG